MKPNNTNLPPDWDAWAHRRMCFDLTRQSVAHARWHLAMGNVDTARMVAREARKHLERAKHPEWGWCI